MRGRDATAADLLRSAVLDSRPIYQWATRWVYFARNRDRIRTEGGPNSAPLQPGDIKIGCSVKPFWRTKDLHHDLIAVVRSGFTLEKAIHQALSPASRIKGEWYHPTPEVLDLIEAAKALDDPAGHYWPPRIPTITLPAAIPAAEETTDAR